MQEKKGKGRPPSKNKENNAQRTKPNLITQFFKNPNLESKNEEKQLA